MSSTETVVDIETLKAQVIEKVRSIAKVKEAKKDIAASYNEQIKVMQEELDTLLDDLEKAQRASIEDLADEILEEKS